jgi:hypothetical protein
MNRLSPCIERDSANERSPGNCTSAARWSIARCVLEPFPSARPPAGVRANSLPICPTCASAGSTAARTGCSAREIKAQGFRGSASLVGKLTSDWRARLPEPAERIRGKQRQARRLDAWLAQAHQSSSVELQGFASGIKRDYAAVQAALSLPWSQGQVEGQMTRLKFLKRQMYGRAHFDLLRSRVLRRA